MPSIRLVSKEYASNLALTTELDPNLKLELGRHPRTVNCQTGEKESLSYSIYVMGTESGMSRHHCALYCEKGSWFVEDNLSIHGTHVNGKLVNRAQLIHGDSIVLGNLDSGTEYVFEEELMSES